MLQRTGSKLLALVLAISVLLPAPEIEARTPRSRPSGKPVAIWTLKSLGLEKVQAKKIQLGVARAFRRNREWRLASQRLLKKRVKKAGLNQRSPLPALAPVLKVSYVITGTIAGLGDEISLDFKALDGKTGVEIRRVSIALPASGENWKAILDELVVRLLSPNKWVGGLELAVSDAGAQVLLDGRQIALTPLRGPINDLVPGKHILIIRKEGFGEFSQFVVIRYQQIARLKVDLSSATVVGLIYEEKSAEKPPPTPPPPKAEVHLSAPVPPPEKPLNWQQTVGWTCLGLGAAAALSSGFLAWHASDLERRVEDRIWTAQDDDLLRDRIAEGQSFSDMSNLMMIGAGSFAVLSGAFLLWGYLAAEDGPRDESAPGNSSASTVLAPSPFPGGMGLGLSGRF